MDGSGGENETTSNYPSTVSTEGNNETAGLGFTIMTTQDFIGTTLSQSRQNFQQLAFPNTNILLFSFIT